MRRYEAGEDASLGGGFALETPPVLEHRAPSGLGAARGVLVALVVGSAVWAVIAVIVLAVSGRL